MLELLDLRDGGERLEPTRLEPDPAVVETVRGILERVRADGDDALVELAMKLDGADLRDRGLVVPPEDFAGAEHETPRELKGAIDALVERLSELHARQLPVEWWDERDGVRAGETVRPLRSVGCYVPGGRALYPSTVCMTVVPAVAAGVEEIVLTTPPQTDGSVAAPVLYASVRAGATRVVRCGGAQAVAAMAFGTDSVPRVDRIVGPGNVYVTEAKRQLAGVVGIDGIAGPSELVVVADETADADIAAADLIAQAEHDPEARTHLVTTDAGLVDRVRRALDRSLVGARRKEIAEKALARARAVLVRDLDHAAAVVDDLAGEHLLILVPDPRAFLRTVRNAGAVFLGEWSAVPFGDYGVWSNHVLPTAGTARFTSGLRAADFVTVRPVVQITREAVASFADQAATLARAEGLEGHARAVELRRERA